MQLINDKRNVLFITAWYPNRENPSSGIFVREHAKAVSLYDSVVVLYLASRSSLQPQLYKLSIENDRFLTEGIITYRFSVKSLPFLKQFTILIETYGIYRSIKKIIRTGFKPDIIHAHMLRAGFIAIILRWVFKCPIVITEQNSAYPRRLLSKADVIKARYAFRKADVVLPVSLALQRAIESYVGSANFQIVRNVVDPSKFFPDFSRTQNDNKLNLVFVGSLIEVKGLDILFKALSDASIQRPWHLDVIGSGQCEDQLKQLCMDLGVSDHVTFHGYLGKESIAKIMKQSDLFILPSLYETMSCVLVEAMASGLPVVASEVGGIPEIIDSDNGTFCQPGNVNSLRVALLTAIENLDNYDRKKIRQKALQFSPEVVGKQLHDIYISLINQHSHS